MPLMLDTIELDDQIQWIDEFTWDAVAQEQERSITGALLVMEGVKLHGRPITLQAGGGAWTPLSVVRQLEALRDQRLKVMPLVLPDGREFWVMFSRADGQAPLEAAQVFRRAYLDDTEYDITIRLITVAPPPPESP